MPWCVRVVIGIRQKTRLPAQIRGDSGTIRVLRMQDNGMDAGFREPDPAQQPGPNPAHLQRRQRLHELVLALIAQQADLELLDGEALLSGLSGSSSSRGTTGSSGSASSRDLARRDLARRDPASWLEHNQRLIQRYQALVRTAATLDALIDQEGGNGPSPSTRTI